MSDGLLTDKLALHALGWRKAPGRYLKPDRGWAPESKFKPLFDIRDAVRLIDAVSSDYSIVAKPGGTFTVNVRAASRIGRCSGTDKARVICLAVADVLGVGGEEKS